MITHSGSLTRNAAAELFGKLGDEVVIDAVLEWAEDNDGPRVSHLDLLDRLVRENSFLFCTDNQTTISCDQLPF